MACKTKIRNLETAAVVDEQIGCLHISMEDVIVVQIAESFEQL
jgi:hypothetical protein